MLRRLAMVLVAVVSAVSCAPDATESQGSATTQLLIAELPERGERPVVLWFWAPG
jgi:hypothetical protein